MAGSPLPSARLCSPVIEWGSAVSSSFHLVFEESRRGIVSVTPSENHRFENESYMSREETTTAKVTSDLETARPASGHFHEWKSVNDRV